MALKRSPEADSLLCYYDQTYGRRTSIQHWQLRDLVHCPDKDSELYCVYRHRVIRFDTRTNRSSTAQELTFEPTSMTVAHGYVAAGGQNSQLDVRTLEGDAVYKGHCGGSVNNAIRVARDASGLLRLFVCNNDDTVKVFSLPGGAPLATVRCPVAINYCALSPSGRHMACVGDNRHCYLYAASPSGWRQAGAYSEASDAGMCCAWAPGGGAFAAASQDGLVAVWDARTSKAVARYATPLACRNVKFAPAPLDLLAFTEHKGRCHLVDTRMWDRQQVLHVGGSPDVEVDLSGLAFSPSGRRLYVGTEAGVVAFDVDTMARRSFPHADLC